MHGKPRPMASELLRQLQLPKVLAKSESRKRRGRRGRRPRKRIVWQTSHGELDWGEGLV